jgi:uncharacterized membrane protein
MMWFVLLLSCGDPATPDTGTHTAADEPDPCSIHWDGWADGFFSTYCRSCHSSTSAERHDAPTGVDFDTEEDVQMWLERIEVRVVDEKTMPVGGGVPEPEFEFLTQWLACQEAAQ